jgi:DNA-binding beta-propeller fold protein YncE
MPRDSTPVALSLISLALLAGIFPSPSSAAAWPGAAAGPRLMQAPSAGLRAAPATPSASPDAATPAVPFQTIGLFGDLAVANSAQLLTVATHIQGDSAFASVIFNNGLALSPTTGKVYVAGFDGANSFLGQVDWNTGNETTIGKISGEVIVDLAFDGAGNLYGLTDNAHGTDQHALLAINTTTAAASVAKVLNPHGGTGDFEEYGALAFNPVDGSLYYADTDSNQKLFIDKLAPGTFAQTAELSSKVSLRPAAMAFAQGSLWISSADGWYTANATDLGADVTALGEFSKFPTPDGLYGYQPGGMFPNALPCTPSPTAACLGNRFKVEVSYDATPANGSGLGSVVLESAESVKFTFFDPSNIEMILKILDACADGNKWWVFAGGLTNVGVTITVTDTTTNAVKHYSSTKGQLFQTFADTSAFPCP